MVNEKLETDAHFSWSNSNWSKNKQLYKKYRELHPNSWFQLVPQFAFWIAVICLVADRILDR
jgi:hypothetical protein